MTKHIILVMGLIGLAFIPSSWPAEKNEKLDKLAAEIQQVLDQKKEQSGTNGIGAGRIGRHH